MLCNENVNVLFRKNPPDTNDVKINTITKKKSAVSNNGEDHFVLYL